MSPSMFGYRPVYPYGGASTNSGNGGLLWLLVGIAFLLSPHLAGANPADKPHKRHHPKAAQVSTKVPAGLSFTNGAGCSPAGDWRRVDPRVRTVLTNAAKRHALRVSCLHTGHSRYVKGTRRVSNHTVWRAVDLDRVDGRPVSPSNLHAAAVARAFGRGRYGAQPSEVGSPWGWGGIWFTDSGHKKHLHVGFRRR